MLKVIESLSKLYEVFYNNGYFLSDEDLADVQLHCDRMAKHYQILQLMALTEGNTLWKTTVKMHYVGAHMHDQAQLINPRYVQGYASESLVGTICEIFHSSQCGPFHRRVQKVAMLKYCTGLVLLWK